MRSIMETNLVSSCAKINLTVIDINLEIKKYVLWPVFLRNDCANFDRSKRTIILRCRNNIGKGRKSRLLVASFKCDQSNGCVDEHRQIESNEKNQRLRKRESIIVGLMLRKMKDESVRKKEIPSNNFYKKINGYGKENRLFSELVSRKVKDEFVEEEHDRIISIKEDERLRKRESIGYSYITKNKR